MRGEHGKTLQKVMKTLFLYGKMLGATRFVPIQDAGHLVISICSSRNVTTLEMLEELIADGLKTPQPFTVDPRPLDFENIPCNFFEKLLFWIIYRKQSRYEQRLAEIGLKDKNAFTCTCYLPEVGNIPARDSVLAWSESSAVAFANSVLGARSNRNSGEIDLLCNLLGKAPLFGLLTDEGRRATCLIDIRTSALPNPHLLGSAIGTHITEGVPYIIGLDKFLGPGLGKLTIDYLKDMGAASASNGAVALYHVHGITPEAMELKFDILLPHSQKYVIDDNELKQVMKRFPVLWRVNKASPRLCFIGCPHLSLNQLYQWTENISQALRKSHSKRLKVKTILCAAPDVVAKFRKDEATYTRLIHLGSSLTSICPAVYMGNPLFSKKPVITNSNKLRTYSTARFYPDEDILEIIQAGQIMEAA